VSEQLAAIRAEVDRIAATPLHGASTKVCIATRGNILDALYAALDRLAADPDRDPYIGPITHSNGQCQKDGCTCWCQACERHNWRHARVPS
jgi:hypothetical protein